MQTYCRLYAKFARERVIIKKYSKAAAIIVIFIIFISGNIYSCVNMAGMPAKSVQPSKSQTGDEFPARPINVIVPYPAGGGTDIGARLLLPYVEKELGVPINVINKSGDNGWAAWEELARSNPDGYTIGYINTPPIIAGYLNPKNKRSETMDNFDLITNHVTDYCVIAIRRDEKRFHNIKELIEYAKVNELTVVCSGFATDDHIAILKINNREKTKFVPVLMDGGMQTSTAILKGYVDVYAGNVGEIATAHKDGSVKAIAVLAPERADSLIDVPILDEAGHKGIYMAARRGLAGPKGIDPAVLNIIMNAFIKAMRNKEHMKKMQELGLAIDIISGEGYKNQVSKDEKDFKEIAKELGW